MQVNTLAGWLSTRDDAALGELLRARPDLATPPPAGTAVLAARAAIHASVVRACEDLDTFVLTVAEALLALDADTTPVALGSVRELLGKGVTATRLAAAVSALRSRAIVWGPDKQLSLVPAIRDLMPAFPGGLGRSEPKLANTDLATILAGLAPPERRVLDTLAAGPPIGTTKDAAAVSSLDQAVTPVQRLLAMGLLIRRDAETVELPLEVAVVLRGNHPFGTIRPTPPQLTTIEHSTSAVDGAAASEAAEVVRHVEELIRLWSPEQPPVLRSGGIGVRELRKAARELNVSEQRATFLVELAAGAELIASSEGNDPVWMPTTLADSWLVSSTEQRWAALAASWLDLPRLPGMVGLQQHDRTIGPLTDDVRRPTAPRERRRVLTTLAELPEGNGVADEDELIGVLAWRTPRQGGQLRDSLVRWTLREAATLGVTALGALSSAGRALLDDGAATAAKQLTEALPEPLDYVLVQADLTVVAPGRLEQGLADDMALVANVESAGSATVYRVSEASVRRALDAGHTAGDLHELFASKSRTPIPQALTYLIDDVARRHGQLRAGMAGSFLRCDDPVLVTQVLAAPIASSLELRRIAPTVLVSPLPLNDVVTELRAAGFAPVAEGPDGSLLDLRPSGHRLLVRRRQQRQSSELDTIDDARLSDLISRIRAGDQAEKARPGRRAATTTTETLALLTAAARKGRGVWLGFVDSHGVASQRVVEPISVGGGVLEGFDRTAGEIRRFPLHLITSAAPVGKQQEKRSSRD